MSFADYESSRTKGHPITLYEIFPINGQTYRYTDAERDYTVPGTDTVYTPQTIRRGSITSSGSLDKASLELRIQRRAAVSEAWRVYPPDQVVNLIIKQVHRDDPAQQALVCWTGRILSCAWAENEIILNCEPVSTSLRRTGLRRHYQIGCPHVLYGSQCAASRLAATVSDIALAAVGGTSVTLPNGWLPSAFANAGKTADKFVGGILEWTYSTTAGPVTMKRTILRVSGNVVQLTGPTTGLVAGSLANMILGCNHQTTDCMAIHGNIVNFGGQPWIPTKNPFGFTNNYY